MKRIVSLLLTLVICFSFSATAFAAVAAKPENDDGNSSPVVTEEHTRAEETKWYYRIIDNSIVQKRLWSLTYGYWKTDWITIGYVDPNP